MLAMNLVRPADQTRLVGSGVARLTAALAQPAPVPLFFKWYSSAASDPLGIALDLPAVDLPLGSQVLTCSAKDQPADTPAALQAVRNAGMAGGLPPAAQPCTVHVLIAELHQPTAGASLARSGATLSARAPLHWARKIPPATAYTLDPDYQRINQLVYRWRFEPAGAPPGRATRTFSPAPADWGYVAPAADDGTHPLVPLLRYAGPLPAGLDIGNYTLTLRVEDAGDATRAHEQAVTVNLL